MKNKGLIWIIIIILVLIGIFLVRIPYTATEIYTEKVPYTAQESYTEQQAITGYETYTELQPITETECKNDISANPMEYFNRGINNIDELLQGDLSVLLEECKEVIKQREITKTRDVIKYVPVTKYRDVIKYKDEQKERQVTKTATPFMMMTGQVSYLYDV